MVTFTVHEPATPAPDRMDRAESLVFVKEGFTWSAAIFTPVWMIVHRLWWPLVAYILAMGTIEGIRLLDVAPPAWPSLLSLALHILIGFEADTLRRWSLDRRGWTMLGSVSGKNAAECERRFFNQWLPDQPVITQTPPAHRPLPGGPPRTTPVIGDLLGARS
jgi:hypothetical protein